MCRKKARTQACGPGKKTSQGGRVIAKKHENLGLFKTYFGPRISAKNQTASNRGSNGRE